MIREITAKTILSTVRGGDEWFGLRYNMNLYRGCEHQCIYCDSRSECYGIENFSDVLVKINAIELLERELKRKRSKGTIGTGSMSDPYTPAERRLNMTGQALELIADHGYPLHIITKSDLVLKDLATLRRINRVWASVAFTITTADDALARILEPGAPSPSRRFAAMQALAEAGITTGITLMPVLPFIEDTLENITQIVQATAAHGGQYILAHFGMTLRDRQRAYYYTQLDRFFPGLRARYERNFGERYSAHSPNAKHLRQQLEAQCAQLGLATRSPVYQPQEQGKQLSLF